MNYIGLLQEHYQKRSKKIPEYILSGSGTEFKARVILDDSTSFNGIGSSKKEAKTQAAKLALENIKQLKQKPNLSGKVYVAIDIENVGDSVKQLEDYDLCGLNVVCFYSEACPMDVSKILGTLDKVLIKSSRKDASDIGLMLYVYDIYKSKEYDKIVIWTKDHYGAVYKEVLQSSLFTNGNEIIVIKNLSEIT